MIPSIDKMMELSHETDWLDPSNQTIPAQQVSPTQADEPVKGAHGRVLELKPIGDYSTKKHDYVDEHPLGYGLELDSGPNDVGKTATVERLAARVLLGTTEGPWHGEPHGVLFILSEEDPGLIKNAMRAHGVTDFIMQRKLFTLVSPDQGKKAELDDYDTADLPGDVPALRKLCRDNDVKLVVIDALIDCMSWANTNSQADVSKAIKPLNKWGAEDDVLIIGIHHNNKSYEGTAKQAVAGSAAFTNKPRMVVSYEKTDEGCFMQFVKIKGRSDKPSFEYVFETRSIRLDDGSTENIGIVTDVRPSDRSIDDIRRERNPTVVNAEAQAERKRAANHEVLEWLHDYLSDGKPVQFDTIRKDALSQEGYSVQQLRDASKTDDSRIVKSKDPDHKGRGQSYVWRLEAD